MNRAFVITIKLDSTETMNDLDIAEEIFDAVEEMFEVVSVNPHGGPAPEVTNAVLDNPDYIQPL